MNPQRHIKQAKRLDTGETVQGYYCFIGHIGKEKHYIIPDYASAFYGLEVKLETVEDIPVKPTKGKYGEYHCPNCHLVLFNETKTLGYDYCADCGQCLSWEE